MMETRTIVPVNGPPDVTVRVPGSKSVTNRALAVAALAAGRTTLVRALFADDTRYMAASLTRLGIPVALDPAAGTIGVEGQGGRIPATEATLDVGNAGTAARFMAAIVALGHGTYVIDGAPRMRERPIGPLADALRALGATVDCPSGCPPVRIGSRGIEGGVVRVAGAASSQFVSALLLAAPCARTPVDVRVTGPLGSRPYVDLTLAVMADFGVDVEREGYDRFLVPHAPYQARAVYEVESDASAASYFFAAAAITGGTVRVEGLTSRSRQGDIRFLDVLSAMGCRVTYEGGSIAATGGSLRGVDVDLSDLPDTAQTLAIVAPFASTPTTVRGIASARSKECDRIAATCTELDRLGVPVVERPDGFTVMPASSIRPATVRTYNDHRMAMAFATLGLRAAGITIEDPSCVAKTFPSFFEELEKVGGSGRADGHGVTQG